MTLPTFSKLLIERPVAGVLRLLINRPDKRNAIDFDVRQQLTEAFEWLGTDGGVRAVVMGGVGGHLSAGGDLPSMVGLTEEDARTRMRHIAALCRLVYGCRLPVVTAMEGFSAGACVGLALLGDHIVAGENTRILFPFMKLGLVPDWGLLHTLPGRVGLPAARRLLVSGETLSGVDAQRLALADEVVADGEVMETALRRASAFAALPRAAFARMKQRLAFPCKTLDEDLLREGDDQAALLLGADFREGYAAFMEKRAADFVGLSDAHTSGVGTSGVGTSGVGMSGVGTSGVGGNGAVS
jgi:2-(1,2-epoxy-1,2-dihydrophenyl)acetyl-CoA isomerase